MCQQIGPVGGLDRFIPAGAGNGMPSCDACGKTELLPRNYEAWGLFCDYPGLIRQGMEGSSVDYQAALRIIDEEAYPAPLVMLRKLEAIRQGLQQGRQSSSGA